MKTIELKNSIGINQLTQSPHLYTKKQYESVCFNQYHAWAIRDLFEKEVDPYCKKTNPTKRMLLLMYQKYYPAALPENKCFVTIGFLNALTTRKDGFSNGNYLYPLSNSEINLSCNNTFDEICSIVSQNTYSK